MLSGSEHCQIVEPNADKEIQPSKTPTIIIMETQITINELKKCMTQSTKTYLCCHQSGLCILEQS